MRDTRFQQKGSKGRPSLYIPEISELCKTHVIVNWFRCYRLGQPASWTPLARTDSQGSVRVPCTCTCKLCQSCGACSVISLSLTHTHTHTHTHESYAPSPKALTCSTRHRPASRRQCVSSGARRLSWSLFDHAKLSYPHD